MPNWNFHLPTRVHFGWGRASETGRIVREMGAKHVFVMASRSYLKHNGGVDALAELLTPTAMTLFSQVEENPSIATVDTAARLCREAGCDAVLAIGGGSVLDASKAVAMLQTNGGSVREYLEQTRAPTAKSVPLVAVPTTSGTGSEVTPYAVITHPDNKAKPAIAFPQNFPDVAIVDPRLTMSMPTAVAASTGLDALCQAIEGFWSRNGNDISRSMAFKAIVMAYRNLEAACLDKDRDAVERMAAASNICGIQMAMVGNTAIHPLSYPFTIDYGVKHGFACAMFLPAFLRFNAAHLGPDFADLLTALGLKSPEEFADRLTGTMETLGAPTRLAPLGVPRDAFPEIARRGVGRSTAANPRDVGPDDIIAICESMY